ncbi:MAG TPA: biopolymer transporter ExbD [Verrucomicrobiales bacterium]|nr:biopolymer transporter ExbD [Verrucomicrobiales bacterium]
MKRFSRRSYYSASTLAELNVTPLLDLAFVLLIIFMITAPLLAERADLILPTTRARRDAVDPSRVVTVVIDRQSQLELNGQPVDAATLSAELARLNSEQPGASVVLGADRELTVRQVSAVMDLLTNAGITDVGFLMRPTSSSESEAP